MRGLVTLPAVAALTIAAVAVPVSAASAGPRHRDHGASKGASAHSGVRYAQRTSRGKGWRPLVSDGEGSGYGFYRLPYHYRVAAREQEDAQSEALRDAVDVDAWSTGGLRSGYLGSNVYSYGNNAAYGVFRGADGYGSPYFAGYYGPGDGEDFGPFGHAYAD